MNRLSRDSILIWAILFEGQASFDGFRTLAANGKDKPVLHYFRMAGLMRGGRVTATLPLALPRQGLSLVQVNW